MNDTLQKTRNVAGESAHSAGDMMETMRRNAGHAVENLDYKVRQLRADTVPAIARSADQATHWARRRAQQVRHGSRQLQAKAHYAAQEGQQYVRDQPVKSMLIAAGVGAVLVGVVSALARRDSRR